MIRIDSAPPADGNAMPINCSSGAIYGQNVKIEGYAYVSDISGGFRAYDDFSGVTEDIRSVEWWGCILEWNGLVWIPCNEDPKSFEVAFYQDNAGAVGTLVTSHTVSVNPVNTGITTFWGDIIYRFNVELPAPISGLSTGWVSVYGNPAGSCIFLWLNSYQGNVKMYQDGAGFIPNDEAYCLFTEHAYPMPLSSWAIYIGIFLIVAFILLHFRRRFV